MPVSCSTCTGSPGVRAARELRGRRPSELDSREGHGRRRPSESLDAWAGIARRVRLFASSPERVQGALGFMPVIGGQMRPHSSLQTLRGAETPAMPAGIADRPLRIRETLRWVVLGGKAAQLPRTAHIVYST